MTSTNVELVRSIFAASYERGDLLAALAWADPEIEFAMVGGPEPGKWHGLDEVKSFLGNFLSAWDGFRAEADDFREIDGEHVLVLTHASGRGKTSGMEIGHKGGCHLIQIHQGKVMRVVFYWDPDRALADLGLDP